MGAEVEKGSILGRFKVGDA